MGARHRIAFPSSFHLHFRRPLSTANEWLTLAMKMRLRSSSFLARNKRLLYVCAFKTLSRPWFLSQLFFLPPQLFISPHRSLPSCCVAGWVEGKSLDFLRVVVLHLQCRTRYVWWGHALLFRESREREQLRLPVRPSHPLTATAQTWALGVLILSALSWNFPLLPHLPPLPRSEFKSSHLSAAPLPPISNTKFILKSMEIERHSEAEAKWYTEEKEEKRWKFD